MGAWVDLEKWSQLCNRLTRLEIQLEHMRHMQDGVLKRLTTKKVEPLDMYRAMLGMSELIAGAIAQTAACSALADDMVID